MFKRGRAEERIFFLRGLDKLLHQRHETLTAEDWYMMEFL